MERDRSEILREFLKEEVKLESDPIGTLGKIQAERNLTRRHNRKTQVIGTNLLGIKTNFPDASYRLIGRVYGVSGQRVQQSIKCTTIELWKLAPPNIQKRYPLEKLMEGRINILNKTGRTVLEFLKEGKTPREIKALMDLDHTMMVSIRESFKRRGLKLGYINSKSEEVINELKHSGDDRHSQEALSRITVNTLDYIRRLEPELLATISEVVSSAGYHASNREVYLFVNILRRKKFPMGKVEVNHKKGRNEGRTSRYYFILSKDKERAKDLLLRAKDPNVEWLRRNPVRVIYGPIPGKMPSTWEINKKTGVSAVRPILSGLGIYLPGGIGASGDHLFGEKCPVTIFEFHSGHFCRVEDVPELERFINKRIKELKKRDF